MPEDLLLKSIKRLQAVGVLTVLVLCGCTAHQKPSDAESALANVAKDIFIPMQAENMKNPLPASLNTVNEGKEIYMQSCALCHGADGHSQTSLGQAMYPPAMDLTSPHVQHWGDSEMYWVIQNGVRLTGMPSWKGILSAEDSWKLVLFIRQLPQLPPVPAASPAGGEAVKKTDDEMIANGRTLYHQEACYSCHQLDGQGEKVGPDLSLEGTRGRSAEWLVGHFKNPTAYVPGSIMPPFDKLTEQQLRSLTLFLMSQKGEKRGNQTPP